MGLRLFKGLKLLKIGVSELPRNRTARDLSVQGECEGLCASASASIFILCIWF